MAEALLLIAERGTDAQLECNPSPRAYAEEVVRGLPGLNDDWRVLASLREQFARLMEAAPGPFLDSLERLIAAHPDDVRRLFAEGERGFGGGAMHTGLLWGLEVLAWSPDYLPRVALILARLARLDPGGRMLNRPINSLREIFLWWYPGTNATLDQRLAAIDLILAREPEVGWTLLANLLPDGQSSISNPTATPRWREFGDLPEDARTRRGQFQYVSAIVDRALDRVGTDPERWRAVLNALRVLSPVQQEQVLDLLRVIVEGSTPSDVKFSLWEVLRDFTSQHRTFQGANWALAGELVDHLEALVSRLAPDDPVARSRWLFDEWLPDLPSGARHLDHREQEVAEPRRQAVSEVLQTQGAEGFVLLGTICKFPGLVAQVAVPLMESPGVARGLVERAIAAGESGLMFAGQLSGQAQQLYGEAWRDLVRNEAKAGTWPPAVIASLLILWPDERATWEDVAAMGKEVAAEYWRRKPSFNIGVSPEDQTYQIDRLIEAGRATEAFYHISHRGEVAPTEVLVRLFDATFDELAQAQAVEAIQRIGLSSYDVREFLDELRKRADLPREELARREYRALPLLVLHAQGLTIHEFMAAEPDFFVDVLCDAFLPAHRDKSEDAKLTSKERTRAQAAYRLLGGMEIVPGQGEGNDIDEDALRRWVDGVRKKAAEVDRAVLADQQIGNILAHTREDPEDGGWPHRVVRNLIDDLAADDIDLGLTIERHKMRGVTTKALYEGGDQERDLARQYRRWADVSRTRWPRIARVLEIIAQGWEEYGRQEDIRAEQDKLE